MPIGSGFGGSKWSIGPWGGSDSGPSVTLDLELEDSVFVTDTETHTIPLRVSQAVAPSLFSVRVTFSNELNIAYPALVQASNYTIPGLTVLTATVISLTEVLLTTTPSQLNILYTVTVGDAESINGDLLGPDDSANFFGFVEIPTFIAGAESPTKVELVFSVAMNINSAFTNPSSYTLTETNGGEVFTILSVTPSGPDPIRRATLHLGAPLKSKEYYAIVVSPSVQDPLGSTVVPDLYIFQWVDMTRPLHGFPLEIPIRDFSGEVTGGILGDPDGQVFFTPAYETVGGDSTIELEEVSVCTRAFDEYHLPSIPDPIPLFTFKPGLNTGTIGISTVLWGTAYRLGQAQLNLKGARYTDTVNPPISVGGVLQSPISDTPATAVLTEPIDITKASFLNDARWKTFPNPSAIVFATASNLSPIGPGPTTNLKLSNNPRYDVRDLSDNAVIVDQVQIGP